MSKTSRTLADGLAVLRLLHSVDGPVTSGDVAKMLNMERTKSYRLLNTLREHGFAGRLDSGAFVATSLIGLLGPNRMAAVAERAEGPLATLAARTSMTSHLSVCEGDIVTAVKVVSPVNTAVHIAYREGSTHDCDKGAAGLVILARQAARGDRPRTDRIDEILERGYWVTRGELQPGAVGVATALDLDGVDASVGLVTIADDSLDLDAIAALLAQAKAELEAALPDAL